MNELPTGLQIAIRFEQYANRDVWPSSIIQILARDFRLSYAEASQALAAGQAMASLMITAAVQMREAA